MKHDNSFITDYCEEQGIFLRGLADLVGISEYAVYNHVHGRRISVPNYIKYSKVIPDLPWETFLGEACCVYEKKGYKRVDLIWDVFYKGGDEYGVDELPFGYFAIFRWGVCSAKEKNQIDAWLGYDSDLRVCSDDVNRVLKRTKAKSISTTVKEYRKLNGLTLRELGNLVGFSGVYILGYEQGALPSFSNMKKLSKVIKGLE